MRYYFLVLCFLMYVRAEPSQAYVEALGWVVILLVLFVAFCLFIICSLYVCIKSCSKHCESNSEELSYDPARLNVSTTA